MPVVKILRNEERPGGAANVARNAAALGTQVTLISVVGDDEAPASLAEVLVFVKKLSPVWTGAISAVD